jgi:putative tryptophan/tyrosine transport system substrate-binding protein
MAAAKLGTFETCRRHQPISGFEGIAGIAGLAAGAGCLAAYGVNFADLFRRAASYVDKILKGVRPGDLPIVQPEEFEFAINLKVARERGLTIPAPVLVQADETIE